MCEVPQKFGNLKKNLGQHSCGDVPRDGACDNGGMARTLKGLRQSQMQPPRLKHRCFLFTFHLDYKIVTTELVAELTIIIGKKTDNALFRTYRHEAFHVAYASDFQVTLITVADCGT